MDLESAIADIDAAAREAGIRREKVEGAFTSAVIAAIRMLGRVAEQSSDRVARLIEENKDGAKTELHRVQELTKHATLAVAQARNAQIALQLEAGAVADRMLKQTLPLFSEKMKEALVIRERRVNRGIMLTYYGVVGTAVLGLFLGGYVMRLSQDGVANGMFDSCRKTAVEQGQKVWCDVSAFFLAPAAK